MNLNSKKGFTLIELLVVVAIISLLTSIVLVSLNVARAKGRDAQRISDIRQLRNALQLYFTDNQSFPTSLNVLAPNYIPTIPKDPLGNTGAACRTAAGYCYAYYPSSNAGIYHIAAQLEYPNAVLNTDRDCTSFDGTHAYSCGAAQYSGAYFDGSTNAAGNNPDYIYDLTP